MIEKQVPLYSCTSEFCMKQDVTELNHAPAKPDTGFEEGGQLTHYQTR